MGSVSDINLFTPLTLRGVTLRNRIGMPPMALCMANDGVADTDFLKVHYGSRAAGGTGMIIVEETAVEPRGRITIGCNGLYNDECIAALAQVTKVIKSHGCIPAVQLAHAGRKASMRRLSDRPGGELTAAEGAWETVAPSALAFSADVRTPRSLTTEEVDALVNVWVQGALNAIKAGFEVLELHGAHGYLIHSFLSPVTNRRTDKYGGNFENRVRFLRSICQGIRAAVPDTVPLLVRLSCTDWVAGGIVLDDTVQLCKLLKLDGVDLIDCSGGGITPESFIKGEPNYQVPFATRIKRECGIPTAAVGLITTAEQAQEIITSDKADLVLIGREMLRNPYWANQAARALKLWHAQHWAPCVGFVCGSHHA